MRTRSLAIAAVCAVSTGCTSLSYVGLACDEQAVCPSGLYCDPTKKTCAECPAGEPLCGIDAGVDAGVDAGMKPPPATIQASPGGSPLTGLVGALLDGGFVVQVYDSANNPVSGYTVSWTAVDGGSIPATSVTNVLGQATATPTLGTTPGVETFHATASGLNGSPVTFTVTALTGPAATLAVSSGNQQTGLAGKALPLAFAVMVTDAYGNPVGGATVTWAAESGGGSIAPSMSMTGVAGSAAAGIATAVATLGADGANTFTATVAGLRGSPVTFNATAATPSQGMSSISATPTSLNADGVTSAAVTVTLQDATGHAIPGIPVVLAASGPASVIDPQSGVTGTSGTFVAHLTSTQAGSVTVTARVGSVQLTQVVQFTNPSCTLAGFTTAGSAVSVGNDPVAVTTGDFNGDGKLDLAIADQDGGTVNVLLGAGDGGFASAPKSPVPVGNGPDALATGDFNGDGKVDLVVANGVDGDVSIMLGDGTGGFTSAAGSPVTVGNGPVSVAVGDFNGDGSLDLAVANAGGAPFAVLIGDGTGQFSLYVNSTNKFPPSLSGAPSAVATGDFTDGGVADLAFAIDVGPGFQALGGDGDGDFLDFASSAFSGAPAGIGPASSLTVGDFNGDGFLDLALTSAGGNTAGVLLGDGTGNFTDAPGTPFQVGNSPSSVTAGDFNGDGHLDLAVANSMDGTVSVLLGDGTGAFSSDVGSPVKVGNAPASVTRGDFNGDGKLDLAVVNASDGTVSVLLSNCPVAKTIAFSSTAGNNQSGPVGTALALPFAVLVTDGSANPVSGFTVAWAAATGGGSLAATSTTGGNGIATATATLGPTGGKDTYTATGTGLTGSPLTFTATAVAPAVAHSSLSASPSSLYADGISASTVTVKLEDASGTAIAGLPVILAATGPASQLDPHGGVTNSSGVFVARLTSTQDGPVTVTASGGLLDLTASVMFTNPMCSLSGFASAGSPVEFTAVPDSVATSDFNGDGHVDMAVATNGGVSVLLGDGTGNFASSTLIPAGLTPTAVVVGDFNGDGSLDLALSGRSDVSGAATVLLGDGTGLFAAPSAPVTVGNSLLSLTAGDFNGDGHLDLAVVDIGSAPNFGGTVSLLLGNGSGGFTMGGSASVGNQPSSMAAGDLDGDGNLDLAVTNQKNDSVTVLHGNGSGGLSNIGGTYDVGTSPRSVTVGDFNGDGNLDLAVANYGAPPTDPGSVTVLLNNANGGFTTPGETVQAGTDPISVTAADFNGDGILDLAVANYEGGSGGVGTLSVLLGNGSGSFAGGDFNPINVGNAPQVVVTADFNGDGKLDLAVANEGDSDLSVLLNQCAGPATNIAYSAGADQSGAVGSLLASPFSVLVTDAKGDPMSGVTVAWAATSGGGSIAPSTSATLDTGIASATATLGTPVGMQSFTASVTGLTGSPVTFTATATAGPTATIAYHAGNGQSGTVANQLSAFAVLVTDAGGNPVSGISVTWVASSGGGSLGSILPTNSSGLAFATATLGTIAGSDTFTASITGLSGSPVMFSATAVAGPATTMAASSGTMLSGNTSAMLASPFGVLVTDTYGNPVSGFMITWTIGMGGAAISPPTSESGSNGIATATGTLGATPGLQQFKASGAVSMGSPVTFTASATGPATTMAYSSGTGQTGAVNASLAAPFTVVVTDALGDPVSGFTITWTAPVGASITPTSQTGTNGIAQATATLGTTPGSETFTASASLTGSPVSFMATAVPGPPNSTHSSIAASPGTLRADGITTSTVTVTLADGEGNLIPGQAVVLASTGPESSLDPLSGTTNSSGVFLTHLTSTLDDKVTVTATSGALNLTTTVTFTNPKCSTLSFAADSNSPFGAGADSVSVAMGDFNGDGKLDLVLDNGTVMLGDGTGSFAITLGAFTVGSTPDSIATGDFNGDGVLDLAVVNGGGTTVSVLQGDGSGDFASFSGSPFNVGNQPSSVTVGDFNGDGILDLAIANAGDDTVTVLLGDGSGGFKAAGSPVMVGSAPSSLTAGDFNGDGKLDLAVANMGSQSQEDTVSVLEGDGSGGFSPFSGSPVTVGQLPTSVITADFNGDGKLDLAVADSGGGYVAVLEGNGGGGFANFTGSPIPLGGNPNTLATGDFNGDGFLDLAAANETGSSVIILPGNGTGAFPESGWTLEGVGSQPASVLVGDFTGDGMLDLVSANGGGSNVSLLLNGCK